MANPDSIAPVAEVKGGPVDFAVVTALKREREAVLKRLDEGYQSLQEDNEPLTYYYGHVTIPSSGERYTVVVVMLLGMGNEEAAVATTRVKRWQPEHVLMVGIAGGVPGKVALGDGEVDVERPGAVVSRKFSGSETCRREPDERYFNK